VIVALRGMVTHSTSVVSGGLNPSTGIVTLQLSVDIVRNSIDGHRTDPRVISLWHEHSGGPPEENQAEETPKRLTVAVHRYFCNVILLHF